MEGKEIYVLVGITGEYEDVIKWYVCASFNKELLDYHRIKCLEEGNRIVNDIHSIKESSLSYPDLAKAGKIKAHALDEGFTVIDSVFDYHILTIPMLGVKKDV